MTAAAPGTAPSPNAETPVVTDALRLVRVLFSPGAVFAELSQTPRFWVPWALVSVVTIVINFFQRPFNQRLRELMLERAGRPASTPSAVGNLIGLVTAPLGVLVVCAIVGGILYVIVSSMGGETTFKRILAVAIHVYPLTLIQQALTVAVLTMRGVASISGPTDMFVSLGADLLLPQDAQVGNFVRFVLAGIGPLQVWQLAITAFGLMAMAKLGKGPAWTAAIINFVIILCLFAGLGAFGMKMAGG